jgi:hypothetical protein
MDYTISFPPASMSDAALLDEVSRLARDERHASARLVAHLAELDARRLFLGAGFPSLFAYCTEALHLSEDAACNRINAARLVRTVPGVLGMLQDGRLNLTTIRLLKPILGDERRDEVLAAAAGKSRREVELLVARYAPGPLIPASIRKLPEPKAMAMPPPVAPDPPAHLPVAALPSPSRRAVVAPLAEDHYKVAFTARAETYRKLRRAQDLMRHQVPDGNPAEIIDRALSLLVEELERRKLAAVSRPRRSPGGKSGSRHIPAEVRRSVWLRDGGRCGFVSKDNRRCGSESFLEFHHLRPHALGGEATVGNIALRCGPHNRHEARLAFGRRSEGKVIRPGTDSPPGPPSPT